MTGTGWCGCCTNRAGGTLSNQEETGPLPATMSQGPVLFPTFAGLMPARTPAPPAPGAAPPRRGRRDTFVDLEQHFHRVARPLGYLRRRYSPCEGGAIVSFSSLLTCANGASEPGNGGASGTHSARRHGSADARGLFHRAIGRRPISSHWPQMPCEEPSAVLLSRLSKVSDPKSSRGRAGVGPGAAKRSRVGVKPCRRFRRLGWGRSGR